MDDRSLSPVQQRARRVHAVCSIEDNANADNANADHANAANANANNASSNQHFTVSMYSHPVELFRLGYNVPVGYFLEGMEAQGHDRQYDIYTIKQCNMFCFTDIRETMGYLAQALL